MESEKITKILIDCRLDMESQKITKFFSFERRTTSIASRRAYNSALKMLAASGNRTHLVLSRISMDNSSSNSVTFFRAIGKYGIEILELMTEFIKTTFEYFRRSVAFVRAV